MIENDRLQQVISVAERASVKIIEIYAREFDVEHKEDRSPLTEADLAAHHEIVNSLTAMDDTIPVLSEESASIPFDVRQSWNTYWLVDPLDGTREFIKRNGEFTVNIALIENGEPVMGVIVVPVTGVCYYALRGQGAYKVVPGEAATKLQVKKFDTEKVLIAGSRSHASERLQIFLDKVGKHELVSLGSSLKSCLVAEGKVDIYPRLGLTSEWDTAAAQCIVEEAGGLVTDIKMQPLRYNTKDSLLNPEFLVIADLQHDWSEYLP